MGSTQDHRGEKTVLTTGSSGKYGSYHDDNTESTHKEVPAAGKDPGCCGRLYPSGFRQELRGLVKMSVPLVRPFFSLFQMSI